jgi:aminoglycoside 3-N-acetyltransferase
MPPTTPVSDPKLVNQLAGLGVKRGGVLLVHTSYSAVRPLEGGPEGLIRALREALGPDGTLVMPSWSGTRDEPFDPHSTASARSLGIVPQIFWRLAGVGRSDHVHAFSAAGPDADFILKDGLPLPPHIPESPVGRVHDLDGQVLLLGVNHEANTTVHLAELLAGVPYRLSKYCTVLREGEPERIDYGENDHCCERFRLVDDWLKSDGLQTEGTVGCASARLADSRSVTRAVLSRLNSDLLIFLHPTDTGCTDCDEARASIGSGRTGGS